MDDLRKMLGGDSRVNVDEVITRGLERETSLPAVAALLRHKGELREEIMEKAAVLNEQLFGKTREFYAVSYISDHCVNSCTYCGHSALMPGERSMLSAEEMRLDFAAALSFGAGDLCILSGEHPLVGPRELAMAARIALEVDEGSLERITFNVAPMDLAGFMEVRKSVDFPLQYRIFQESYDREIYRKHHLRGPKADFDFRAGAQERALKAGFDHVGLGVLAGLNPEMDFEILSLIEHATRTQPYTVSLPRLQKVEGSCFEIPHPVSDEDYVLYNAILKLAIPHTRIIATRRESREMLDALRPFVNMEDLATKPGVGGNYRPAHYQNALGDSRSAPEIIADLREKGYRLILGG